MKKEDIIIAKDIHKTYCSGLFHRKRTEALRGISLSVTQGEIFGILGPNGAGKTTLQNIFASLLLPDAGTLIIDGITVTHHYPANLKQKINISSGNPNFPWSLTVIENLTFYGMLYGLKGKMLKEKIGTLIDMFELTAVARKPFEELSTGNKQRLSLAKSLINDPVLLLLDEPTVGLDPDVARRIRELILSIHKQRPLTIILTTHHMAEAEKMCNRIAFMRDGEIKALGTSAMLKNLTQTQDLEGVFLELAK